MFLIVAAELGVVWVLGVLSLGLGFCMFLINLSGVEPSVLTPEQ